MVELWVSTGEAELPTHHARRIWSNPLDCRVYLWLLQVPPMDVASELLANMNHYMELLKQEEKNATKLKKAIDDVGAVVKNGAEFDKEISGASVVDMQMLLFNTRNMLRLKERYMNAYKNTSNEQQQVARRLRNSMNDQLQNPQVQQKGLRSPSGHGQRSSSSLGFTASRPTTYADQSSILDNSLDSSMGGLSLVEELSFLRRRVKELERGGI
jgi:hypothetical protein